MIIAAATGIVLLITRTKIAPVTAWIRRDRRRNVHGDARGLLFRDAVRTAFIHRLFLLGKYADTGGGRTDILE